MFGPKGESGVRGRGGSPVTMAKLEHSSQNLLEIKYRAMTKLDVLGRGWGGGGGVGDLGRGSLLKHVLTSQSPPPNPENSKMLLTAPGRGIRTG